MTAYDLIVLGGGPGGYAAAEYAAKNGLSVALIERDRLGGTCLQRGCVPTKSYLHDASPAADRQEMLERKNQIVLTLTQGIAQLLQARKVAVFEGMGTLESTSPPFLVSVTPSQNGDVQQLQGKQVLIATGGKPARLPVSGCNNPAVFTSDDLLSSQGAEPFSSLVIIGGGVIGVEMACIYARMGVSVTIVEAEKNCLPMLDRELSRSAEALLTAMGCMVLTGARLQSIQQDADGFTVNVDKNGEQLLRCERVLLATGRKPMTDGLFGENLSLPMERGALLTDANYETPVKGIYAIGDVNGQCPLAHAAHAQGLAAVAHMLGKEAPINPTLVPSCVYTTPEIASVGLTQDEAKAQGIAVKAVKALTTQSARGMIENLGRGFIKLIFDKQSNVLLGAQLFCGRATDLLGELTLAIECKLTAAQLLRAMRAHPSFYEAVTDALEKAVE
ncbi:MAG: FAD-dependent oxidoreductase [Clostridia bacterium]